MENITLKSGFFNSTLIDGEPDRVYTAEQLNDYLKGLVSENGIYANISSDCQVVASDGMNVILKTGRGKVGSNWFEIDNDITIPISASDVVLNRIDSIVIQRNNSTRLTAIVLKVGQLSSNPIASVNLF